LVSLAAGHPERVAVVIEKPDGPVVETLLDCGIHVYSINPKQVDRFRDRHSVAGAKDDVRDAFVMADALLTDQILFRRVKAGDPAVIELRELTRGREDLKEQRVRLANQLRELLLRYFPQVLALSAAADDKWIWALLEKAADPLRARTLRRAQLEKILKDHRISRFTVDDVRRELGRQDVIVAPGVREAVAERVRLIVPQLQLVTRQVAEVDKRIAKVLERLSAPEEESAEGQKNEHRDAAILLSLPGAGNTVVATMLAEAWQPLVERDYTRLRLLMGIAPVTRRTGKQGKHGRRIPVLMRRACNQRLRNSAYYWSCASIRDDARAKELYAEHRAKGQSHGRALRSVAEHLLRVAVAMLRDGTLYDPAHGRISPPVSDAKAA
jgi:transposase